MLIIYSIIQQPKKGYVSTYCSVLKYDNASLNKPSLNFYCSLITQNLKDWYLLCLTGVLTLIVIGLLTIGEMIPETSHTPTLVNDTETSQTKLIDVSLL